MLATKLDDRVELLMVTRPSRIDVAGERPRTEDEIEPRAGTAPLVGELADGMSRCESNVHWRTFDVTKRKRSELKGQRPLVLWFTGLSGAGKSTLANLVERRLHERGRHTYLLDGDNVRHGLSKDLGFAEADRSENIRRISEVAKLFVDAGLIVLTAFISPFRADRLMARRLFGQAEFLEAFIDISLEEAERRDPKGLYRRARRGELKQFTGVDSPYERPEAPEIYIDTQRVTLDDAVSLIFAKVEERSIAFDCILP